MSDDVAYELLEAENAELRAELSRRHEEYRKQLIKLTTRYNEVVDGDVDTWTASKVHAKLVCLGMDCFRLALGMDPVNYDAERVRELINTRIDQYLERGTQPVAVTFSNATTTAPALSREEMMRRLKEASDE